MSRFRKYLPCMMTILLLLAAYFLPQAGARWQEAVSTESTKEPLFWILVTANVILA